MSALLFWQDGVDKLMSFTLGKAMIVVIVAVGIFSVAGREQSKSWRSASKYDKYDPVETHWRELVKVQLWRLGGKYLAYVYEAATEEPVVVRIPQRKFRKIAPYLFRFGDKVEMERVLPDTEIQLEKGNVLFVPYQATKREVDRFIDFTIQYYDKNSRDIMPELKRGDTCWHLGPVVLAWHFATGAEERVVPIDDTEAYGHYLIFPYMPVQNGQDYDTNGWEGGEWKALAYHIYPHIPAVKIWECGEVLRLRHELGLYMDLAHVTEIVPQMRE